MHNNNVHADEKIKYFQWKDSHMKGSSRQCTFSWELLKWSELVAWVLCIRQSICLVYFVESKYFEWLCVDLLWIMNEDFYILRLQIVTCISFCFLLQVGNTTVPVVVEAVVYTSYKNLLCFNLCLHEMDVRGFPFSDVCFLQVLLTRVNCLLLIFKGTATATCRYLALYRKRRGRKRMIP